MWREGGTGWGGGIPFEEIGTGQGTPCSSYSAEIVTDNAMDGCATEGVDETNGVCDYAGYCELAEVDVLVC